mgnify:CR=1 FL=1
MGRSSAQRIKQAREKIVAIRRALAELDYLCSGTLSTRMKVCGKPSCRCAQDPLARHVERQPARPPRIAVAIPAPGDERDLLPRAQEHRRGVHVAGDAVVALAD